MKLMRSFIFCLFAFTLLANAAQGDHRVALLIGNSEYDGAKLTTPGKDVRAVAAALTMRGFRTTIVENLDSLTLRKTIDQFATTAPTRSTALIYFSGYALPGRNSNANDFVLTPTGVAAQNVNELLDRAYPIASLLQTMNKRSGATNILLLIDGCYRHPKQAAAQAGFNESIELPQDTLLALAAKPGTVLTPGEGETSAMATSLVKHLADEKLAPIQAIKNAAGWSKSTLDEKLTLVGPGTPVLAAPDQFPIGKKAGDEWVSARGIVFCWCPPGTFTMGSPPSEPGRREDETQSEVTFRDGFWIGKYEVTILENPRRSTSAKVLGKNKNHPITLMNQDDARKHMTQTILTGEERRAGRLPEGWEYDLPSEAEWEYAARAGTTTAYHFGDDVSLLPLHGNFADKALYDTGDLYYNYAHRTLNDNHASVALVGSYLANPWGIYDMYGNVAEWCDSAALRGGSYLSTADTCRSAYRNRWPSRNERDFIGFRLVIRKQQIPAENKK